MQQGTAVTPKRTRALQARKLDLRAAQVRRRPAAAGPARPAAAATAFVIVQAQRRLALRAWGA
eukprot:351201-Chlamydomonas_euryale.AAC.8